MFQKNIANCFTGKKKSTVLLLCFVIQPLVIVCSCVTLSVCMCEEKSEDVEPSFQDNDLYCFKRKESYLCPASPLSFVADHTTARFSSIREN